MSHRGTRRTTKGCEQLPALLLAVLAAIEEHKGIETTVFDLRKVSSFTDYLIVSEGRAEPHVRALAEAIKEAVTSAGTKPLHIEGVRQARWILIDCVEIVINVFSPEARSFYELERLWRDAPLLLGGDGEGR